MLYYQRITLYHRQSSPSSDLSAASHPHAVIVDDEQSYLDLLGAVLAEHLSCPVATFVRPLDALEAIKELEIGIIVTDFYMPEINGVELLQRAATLKPGVPAIMITGHADALNPDERDRLTNLKAVLAKPFGVPLLADHIRKFWPESSRS